MGHEAEPRAWDHAVDDRISEIIKSLNKHTEFCQKDVPGLKELLVDYESQHGDYDYVEFYRGLLKMLKDSETDGTYSNVLKTLSPAAQQQIERFVEGERPEKLTHDLSDALIVEQGLEGQGEESILQRAARVLHISSSGVSHIKGPSKRAVLDDRRFDKYIKTLAGLSSFHEDKRGIKVYTNEVFKNWGHNISNTPQITCVPQSTLGIQVIVKFAKTHNLSVRCSGYRHSWSPIFGRTGQVLISLLDLPIVDNLPNTLSLPLPLPKPIELEEISLAAGKPRIPGNSLVRVGCSTTNERLRRWCVKNNKVTIPLNVIMVEITMGGSNAPICHGAGRRHQTLSDIVRKIEYVDANGEVKSVEKPEHLRAASGCFGLMGVVTHITLEFEPMTYAQLDPKAMPVIYAVPPPPGMDESSIPPVLLEPWKKLSSDEKKGYQADFERRATNDYYAEWFWFPYSDNAWVNTWNTTPDPKGAKQFPDDLGIFLSFIETVTMNMLQNAPILNKIIDVVGMTEASVTLISRAAMLALPKKPVKTWVPDALHFQRAIQNVRVRNVEIEMPLVAKANSPPNTINYAPVQQAWWDAILLVYKNSKTCPMRMPLEMRIMGGSDVVMAPQHGNALGTCAIEILTLKSAAPLWQPFAQSVLDKWMALKDPYTGQRLRSRPHWAKEWYDYKVDGKPWVDRLKSIDYKDERKEFLQILAEIGKEAGWTLTDSRKRFSNDLFDQFIFDKRLRRNWLSRLRKRI